MKWEVRWEVLVGGVSGRCWWEVSVGGEVRWEVLVGGGDGR